MATSGALCIPADVLPRFRVPAIFLLTFPERLKAGEQELTVLFAAVQRAYTYTTDYTGRDQTSADLLSSAGEIDSCGQHEFRDTGTSLIIVTMMCAVSVTQCSCFVRR